MLNAIKHASHAFYVVSSDVIKFSKINESSPMIKRSTDISSSVYHDKSFNSIKDIPSDFIIAKTIA